MEGKVFCCFRIRHLSLLPEMVRGVISASLLLPGVRRDARTATQRHLELLLQLLVRMQGLNFNFLVQLKFLRYRQLGCLKTSSPIWRAEKKSAWNHQMGLANLHHAELWMTQNHRKTRHSEPSSICGAALVWLCGFLQILHFQEATRQSTRQMPWLGWTVPRSFRKSRHSPIPRERKAAHFFYWGSVDLEKPWIQ